MPVTLEEQNRYYQYISNEVKALGGLDFGPDVKLWHYTGALGLLGIISSHQLRATANDCLNDSTEIFYAEDLYRRAIRQLFLAGTEIGERYNFLKRMLDYLDQREGPIDEPQETSYYITCFSEKGDDLSQWRAYGDAGMGNGYAVAFSRSGHIENNLVKVNYNSEQHVQGAARLALATLDYFMEGLAGRPGVDPVAWYEEFVPIWDQIQYWLAPIVKHASFSVESEYRVIKRMFETRHESILEFQPKRSFISRFISLPHYNPDDTRKLLPIVEVMVGPGKHQRESMRTVTALLRKHGYSCPVTLSASPAQRE